MTATVAEVLSAAAADIERNGLFKGRAIEPGVDVFADVDCRRCAWGAILRQVGRDRDAESAAISALVQAIGGTVGGTRLGAVATWNDAPDITQADVVAALRKAAELAAA